MICFNSEPIEPPAPVTSIFLFISLFNNEISGSTSSRFNKSSIFIFISDIVTLPSIISDMLSNVLQLI